MTDPGEKESFDALRNIFLSDVGVPEDHEATRIHTNAALFGQIAVNERIISQNQLQQALEEQKKNTKKKIGNILMEKGVIQLSELITILRAQRKVRPSPLGNIGPYFLLEELGRGGVGRVYHAVHEGLLKQVAIKILEPSREISEEMLKRFHREAMVAARLQHPNIVAVHDVGNIGEVHYIVMDYLEGEPLSAWLAREENPLQECLLLLQKVVQTVGEAHAQGVLHRDLKPENVIVRNSGEPVLVDFGLARGTEDLQLTQSGMVMGTPLFMSPEQVQGDIDRVGVGTDIFSLGVMLYFATTGRYPFYSETPRKLYEMIINKEPVRPTSVKDSLPSDIDIIISRCLEKDPENRYPSASMLAEDLKNCALGDPILATKVATVIRFWRRMQRRPSLVGSALFLILLVMGGSAYFYFQDKKERRLKYALELNSSYGQLHPQISEWMKEADTIRYRRGSREEVGQILQGVDRAVTASSDQTGIGEGYRGWIRFLLRLPEGIRILTEAKKTYPENPFLNLLLARTHLRNYLDQAAWPDAGFTAEAVQVPYVSLEPEETEEMLRSITRARALLQEARKSDIWNKMPALQWGIDLSEGFEAYSSGELEGAITHLEKLESRPDLALEGAYFLVLSYCRAGKAHEAIPVARRLVSRRPELLPAKRQLAACHQFLGAQFLTQNREATSHFLEAKKLISAFPSGAEKTSRIAVLNLLLAISESKEGNIQKAKAYLGKSRASYETLLKRWPDNIRYRVNLARSIIDLGALQKDSMTMSLHFREASEQINKALEIEPENRFLLVCRLDNELTLSQIAAREGTLSRSEWKKLERDLEEYSKDSEAEDQTLVFQSKLTYSQGFLLYKEGKKEEALKAIRKSIRLNSEALEISPGMVGIRKDLLNKSFLLVEWEQSEIPRIVSLIRTVDELTSTDPLFRDLPVQLARWLGRILPSYPPEEQKTLGLLEIEAWEKVLKQNSRDAGDILRLGDSFRRQAKRITSRKEKRELIQKAISRYAEVNPKQSEFPNALRGQSAAYLDLFRAGGAQEIPPEECLKEARLLADRNISMAPADLRGRENRLQILTSVLTPDTRLMSTDVEAGFGIDPQWRNGSYWKAKIYFLKGDLEKALSELRPYLSTTPEQTEGTLLEAHIRLRQKRFGDAITAAQKVIEQRQDHLEAWMIQGYGYLYMKKNSEAIDTFQQARIYSKQQQNDKVTRAIDRILTDLKR